LAKKNNDNPNSLIFMATMKAACKAALQAAYG
jgi:hypothetical protein